MHVVRVPVQVSDTPVVLTGVQHDKIEERANGERAPNPEVVVHLYLADGHPFEVCAYSIHLTLVNRHTAVHDERGLGVVKLRRAIAVGVVRHFMVVPDRDPRECLMAQEQVLVCTVGRKPLTIIVERVDDAFGRWNAVDGVAISVVSVTGILVDVIAKMENIVNAVFAGWIAVSVEEAELREKCLAHVSAQTLCL